jgi:hypothetical protein
MTETLIIDDQPTAHDVARPSWRRWTRRDEMRALARRHWPFLIVLSAGAALRIAAQVAYRPALLYIDSYRYLDLVRSFDPAKSQMLGYDALVLWPLLKIGNLFVVATVQHLIGLALGVAIYALCRRYGVSRWIAAAAAAPVLLDAYQIQIEQNVMSETLFEALLAGAMVSLLWRRRPSRRALVVGGLLLGAAVCVRIVALPLVAPAMIYACVSGAGIGPRLRRLAIVGVAFLLPVLGYMAYYHSQAGTWGLTPTDARAAYGRAAQIADCDLLHLPPSRELLCPRIPVGERTGIDYYAHVYPVQALVEVPDGQTLNDVVRDFARRVFRNQPLDLVHAVATDFGKGFRWDHTNARGDVPVERWQFQTHWPLPEYDPAAATSRWGGGPPTVVKPVASFLRAYQLSIGYTPGPLVAVAFLGGILGGCGVYRSRRSGLRAVCWLPTLSGLAVLLAADAFEFSWRYQLPALILAPLAGAIGYAAIFRDPQTPYPAIAPGRARLSARVGADEAEDLDVSRGVVEHELHEEG